MEWFFSFDEGSAPWYTEMVKVAVISAKANTTLTPRCIYDGETNALTEWLASQGVDVIFDEVPFKAHLSSAEVLTKNAGTVYTPQQASGAYLRTISAKHADGEVYLYTDCDVMFMDDAISNLTTDSLSAVGEGDEWSFNSGVLLINRHFWLQHFDTLVEFCKSNHFFAQEGPSFDQVLLNKYFRHRWHPLHPEMNWRPFDGVNKAASIVHFHGPKPHRVKAILAGNAFINEVACIPLLQNKQDAYTHFIEAFYGFLVRENNAI